MFVVCTEAINIHYSVEIERITLFPSFTHTFIKILGGLETLSIKRKVWGRQGQELLQLSQHVTVSPWPDSSPQEQPHWVWSSRIRSFSFSRASAGSSRKARTIILTAAAAPWMQIRQCKASVFLQQVKLEKKHCVCKLNSRKLYNCDALIRFTKVVMHSL